MDLGKEIVVRYRSVGHVRFQLPAALNDPAVAQRLTADLHRIEGIYRVDLAARQRKLSIRFIEHVCSLQGLAHELRRLVTAIEWTDAAAAQPSSSGSFPAVVRQHLFALRPIHWVRAKAREMRETVTAMGIVVRRQSVQQKAAALLNEETVIHYLNDVLLIFLIKLHWPQIRQLWIKQPWVHRYEWMAASYMIYLLVRSRRPTH